MAIGPDRLVGSPFFVQVTKDHRSWRELFGRIIVVQEYKPSDKYKYFSDHKIKWHVVPCTHNNDILGHRKPYKEGAYVILKEICTRLYVDNQTAITFMKQEDLPYD